MLLKFINAAFLHLQRWDERERETARKQFQDMVVISNYIIVCTPIPDVCG